MDEEKNSNFIIEYHPLTPERWKDFESLFGERGACGGCWCMYWRLKRSLFNEQKGEKNKQTMKKIVETGEIPGVIAYINSKPIGWCSIAPRETFPVLENSRVLKRIDNKPVWSIVCLFIAKSYRKQGLSNQLIKAMIEYTRIHGGKIIEGYPYDIKKRTADPLVWTGLLSTYEKAGFVEVARKSKSRPIMRFYID